MAVCYLIYFNIITLFCHCGFQFLFSVFCYHVLDSPKLAELLKGSLGEDGVPLPAVREAQQFTRHERLSRAALLDGDEGECWWSSHERFFLARASKDQL